MELFEGSGVCAPMSSGLPLLLLSSAPSDRAWGCAAGAPCSGRWELGCVRARPRQGRLSRGAQAPLSPSPTRPADARTLLSGGVRPLSGLSPLVRGNRRHRRPRAEHRRTIPARAGEPPRGGRSRGPRRDYPRSCGGTAIELVDPDGDSGLSPLVRGNRRLASASGGRGGTIPARAGEPSSPCTAVDQKRDYPRSCGGTSTVPLS